MNEQTQIGSSALERAKAAFTARETSAALALLDRYISQSGPTLWANTLLRARILERLGRFDEARHAFEDVLSQKPGHEIAQGAQARIDIQAAAFQQAREALAGSRPEEALEVLQDLPPTSASIRNLLQARALYDMNRFAAARQAIDRFLVEQPSHKAGREVLKQIAEADGLPAQLPEARTEQRKAAVDQAVLDEISRTVASLEVALTENGEGADALIATIRSYDAVIEGLQYQDSTVLAKAAHFAFADGALAARANYSPHLIEKSVEFDYITWPKRIQQYIRGKSVLDVGCGFGAFGNGFLVAGAREYTGVDPAMPLDSPLVKDKRIRKRADLGMTPRQVMVACPNIHLVNGVFEDFDSKSRFDVIVLHNVTEHLMQIEQVMAGIRRLMTPDSRLIFHHHNFFCWNGHHQAPNQPAQYDETNNAHKMFADWKHILISKTLPAEHYLHTGLNQIRLDALKDLVNRTFDVELWQEINSSAAVERRLIPSRLKRLQDYDPSLTRRDLMVNAVFCVAQLRKPVPGKRKSRR